jgi:MFS family permease
MREATSSDRTRFLGQIVFGHLVDKAPYTRVMVVSGIGAALSAYLLWGFAYNLGLIFAFVVLFGSLVCPFMRYHSRILSHPVHPEWGIFIYMAPCMFRYCRWVVTSAYPINPVSKVIYLFVQVRKVTREMWYLAVLPW